MWAVLVAVCHASLGPWPLVSSASAAVTPTEVAVSSCASPGWAVLSPPPTVLGADSEGWVTFLDVELMLQRARG